MLIIERCVPAYCRHWHWLLRHKSTTRLGSTWKKCCCPVSVEVTGHNVRKQSVHY